jgi:hypothetical protein
MSLTSLWNSSPEQLSGKLVQQIIAFAGTGKLTDGSKASQEFRDFLANIPSSFLERYAAECLTHAFVDSGLALQDIVNEVGRRLGFTIEPGLYRGKASHVGFDGVWRSNDGKQIVVEVKTTDAFRLALDTPAEYRKSLVREGKIREEESSILIVVGREDTGDLEAQIRGSRHAWDVRLISVDALIRLMKLKEEVEDPSIARKIVDILVPHEYTRVDSIIDLVFSTTEDVLGDESPAETRTDEPTGDSHGERLEAPLRFHDAVAAVVERHLNKRLLRQSRTTFTTSDRMIGVICLVSKQHVTGGQPNYWYGFHPYQAELLEKHDSPFVAFGCGTPDRVVLIPFSEFRQWLEGMHTTNDGRFYWHVQIYEEDGRLVLHRKRGMKRIDVTKFLVPLER